MTDPGPCVVGIDFGTLSARAVVVSVADGAGLGSAVADYRSGVVEGALPGGQSLPPDYALQDPDDWLEALGDVVPGALRAAGVAPEHIVGIGTDFTSATVIPATADGEPLRHRFPDRPHAWPKLWKHHGAEEQARRMTRVARERGESWLARYGGNLSAELLPPKVLETLEEDQEVYGAAGTFVNAADWIVWQLTGALVAAAGDSGYKRLLQDGRPPSREYLTAVNPAFADVYADKLAAPIQPLGSRAGHLTPEWARRLGLRTDVAVAVGCIDAHAAAPAVQAVDPGQLLAAVGTSGCYLVSAPELHDVPGLLGVVDGGLVEGLWGYEMGQTGLGDIFAWFVDHCVPARYHQAAEQEGISLHEHLTRLAEQQAVGQHGLVALDWHNGNRSILADSGLTGLLVGQTLTTRPEDQYRALLESTAFSLRVITETLTGHGVAIDEVVAGGGLVKNRFWMQLISDVTRLPISVGAHEHASAVGAAIHGAVAAGAHPDVRTAAARMGARHRHVFVPDHARAAAYDEMYLIYRELHDHFGDGRIMHHLRALRRKETRN